MKSRALLVGVAAAIIAIAAYLWRAVGAPEDRPPPEEEPAAGTSPRVPPSIAGDSGSREEPASNSRAEDGTAGRAAPAERGTRRDHRGMVATHPRPHRPGDRPVYPVAPAVIGQLRRSLRPAIKSCSDEFAADLAPGARIQGSLGVSIRGGLLSVLDVEVQSSGVPATSGLVECARKAFAAAELRADGHGDVERHVLRFPFQVPVK